MIDLTKFQTREAAGIFTDSVDYEDWQQYKHQLVSALKDHEDETKFLSFFQNTQHLQKAKELAKQRPETAVHILIGQFLDGDMTAWNIMNVLEDLTGTNPVPKKYAGKYYRQIACWLNWFCDLQEQAERHMQTEAERHLKPCPFCGGPAAPHYFTYTDNTVKEQGWQQPRFHGVKCTHCGVSNIGLRGHETTQRARELWNTRVA